MSTARTSSSNGTAHFEDGERVYPCRCGEVHRGPYAAYDYGHHNCFHDEPLVTLADYAEAVNITSGPENRLDVDDVLMCVQCGKSFVVERGAV